MRVLSKLVLAVVTALELNVEINKIIEGIESWKPLGDRGRIIPLSLKKDLFIKIAIMQTYIHA